GRRSLGSLPLAFLRLFLVFEEQDVETSPQVEAERDGDRRQGHIPPRGERGVGVPVRMLSPAANGGDLVRVSLVWVSSRSYGCGG
ncbi:hypothetical protein AB0P17_42490, partial [Streptomyces sp. NPDC088124]|uniref:hypothetical protein n=1 Tax=Streptomyces sp. NPDC088124 TaxID=3154654 RepID=UPI003434965C